jgi:tRNA U34 5-methylaminomethyl-2-thiouridine-forming methyltransferase MnmC
MSLKIYSTLDHSNTLFNEDINETYHSRNGALEESNYVFIEKGLNHVLKSVKSNLNILEIGFGTGLNAILTLQHTQNEHELIIQYDALETTPLPLDLITLLGYNTFLSADNDVLFENMHSSKWNVQNSISNNFQLHKINARLQDFIPAHQYDLIYFDAFAPDKQPDMWTIDIFAKLYLAMNKNGVLVTYSSKGEVKRNLRLVGFEVERLQGPPKKRHMLRATKA